MIDQPTANEYLTRGLKKLLLPLPASKSLDQLWQYFVELGQWSKKINLIAKASDLQILENHFLDSLTLLSIMSKSHWPALLDIGSGAGFPGLVLKIAQPDIAVTLVEPRQKRTAFLRHVIRKLALTDIQIINARLEKNDASFCRNYGFYPVVTCRALTEIRDFLSLAVNVLIPGGIAICMKGPKASEEIAVWQKAPGPFSLLEHRQLQLPYSNAQRSLVVFQKNVVASPS